MTLTPLFALGTPEIILILVVILLLFGAKRIPDLMKSMGKGVKSFKEGMKEVEDEIKSDDSASEKKDK
ncbi:MAG: twin-arginine translocase TatA/TatE family subunit [Bacteroidaceae bacterium]|nr:twin-arginine translocase TatA/TatE family subunit [Bacteroidaceae bacterium]